MKFLKIAMALIVCYTSGAANGENLSTQQDFSDEELAQILAPIALYPDTLLSHILIAATYPLEVVQAERWATRNPDLEPDDAVRKTADKPWDPSVKALVQFPELLERLSDNLEWTQDLGDAFLQDEERLLASIQILRHQANNAGSFDNVEQITVVHDDDNIVIQPIETEVIYIPYYDTRVAYGNWRWDHYPPVYWERNWRGRRNYYSNSHHHIFSWHPTSYLSTHFLFGNVHWSDKYIVVNNYGFGHNWSKRNRYSYGTFDKSHTKRWTHNPSHRRGVSYRHSKTKGHHRSLNRGSNRYYGSGSSEYRKKSGKRHSNHNEKRKNHNVGLTNPRRHGAEHSGVNSSNHRKETIGHKRKTSNPGFKQAIRNAHKQERSTATSAGKQRHRTQNQANKTARSTEKPQGNHSSKSKHESKKSFNSQKNRHAKIKKERQRHGTRAEER